MLSSIKQFVIIALLFCGMQAFGQSHTVSGTVTDTVSGETLIGATVLDMRSGKGALTNDGGRFSLTLKGDTAILRISYVGYRSVIDTVILTSNQKRIYRLRRSRELKSVTVRGEKVGGAKSSQISAVDIPIEQIKSVPVLFGEADLVKALQLLPGVQSGSEGSSGMYVRGGGPDENLFLLDGVPLYNVSHMGGFFSTFNTDAVKNVTLYKGSFPAHYSGRLSSVLEVTTNDGDDKHLHGGGSIGFVSARVNLEGPIRTGRTTFSFSARRTYADLFLRPLMPYFSDQMASSDNDDNKEIEDADLRAGYYFYDINGKVAHRFNDRNRIFASFYLGNDVIYTRVKTLTTDDEKQYTDFDTKWGNIVGSLRWNQELTPRIFANYTLAYTRYRNIIGLAYETKSLPTDTSGSSMTESGLDYTSKIQDVIIKADYDFTPAPEHLVKFGAGVILHRFQPEVTSGYFDNYSSATMNGTFHLDTAVSSHSLPATETSLYVEDDWSINDIVKVNYGLNMSAFAVDGAFYPTLQPRLSGRMMLGEGISVKAGYSYMTQFMHLLSTTSISMPTDLWVPVTAKVKPMQAHQVAAGFFYELGAIGDFSIEGYYKKMDNLLEYKEGASFWGSSDGWEEKVVQGEGWAYGIEFLLQRNVGRLTGWIGYTWSKSMRLFDRPGQVINNGDPFPAKYDRRHDISIVLNYKISDRVDISATWVFCSGNAATLSMQEYAQAQEDVDRYAEIDPEGWYGYFSTFEGRNNFRLPDYHRMDIAVNFHRNFEHCSRTLNVSIYNLYNRKNPYMIYESHEHTYRNYNAALVQLSLFPILPSVSYTLKF